MEGDAAPKVAPAVTLSSACLRNLADSKHDVRKKGASDVEAMVKQFVYAGEWSAIRPIINTVVSTFTRSVQPSARKGGLLAQASIAIALHYELGPYLEDLVLPVVECLRDADTEVRFRACESMYNIMKTARGNILLYFPQIFQALLRLSTDHDQAVHRAFQRLDRLLKDTASESQCFDLSLFVELIVQHIHTSNPWLRQFIVLWIQALQQVPGDSIILYLKAYLGGLFEMLGDRSKDIFSSAEALLGHLLDNLFSGTAEEVDTRLAAVGLDEIVPILAAAVQSGELHASEHALKWLAKCLNSDHASHFLPHAPKMLLAILPQVSDPHESVRTTAVSADTGLRALIRNVAAEDIPAREMIAALAAELRSREVPSQLAALQWVVLLFKCLGLFSPSVESAAAATVSTPAAPTDVFEPLFPALLATLSDDSSDDVVILALGVLALLSRADKTGAAFSRLVTNFVAVARRNVIAPPTLALIVRQLSALLSAEAVLREMATVLAQQDDQQFVYECINTLFVIVLTSYETNSVRQILQKGLSNPQAADIFQILFKSWSSHPVAVLSICLLAGADDFACDVVSIIGSLTHSVELLLQLDTLIQLLESPVFTHLRLKIAEPERNASLIKCLYSILMLLPQSPAYDALSNRLRAAGTLHLVSFCARAAAKEVQAAAKRPVAASINFPALLSEFHTTQEQYVARFFCFYVPLFTSQRQAKDQGCSEESTNIFGIRLPQPLVSLLDSVAVTGTSLPDALDEAAATGTIT